MCLSTVYQDVKEDGCILMKNVMTISADGGELVFTDLMGRELRVAGRLMEANLVEGYVLVGEPADGQKAV